jgi:hypothetical protein
MNITTKETVERGFEAGTGVEFPNGWTEEMATQDHRIRGNGRCRCVNYNNNNNNNI